MGVGWFVKSVIQAVRRMQQSGLLWLVASVALFLVGASSFSGAGMKEAAAPGVAGAIAAVAVIVAFLA